MDSQEQTIFSHFQELKIRILISIAGFLVASVISYFFSKEIYLFLMKPLESVISDNQGRKFIFTNLTEVFFSYVKLAAFSGFIFSFPLIASQIYLFIAPGLYKNEKRIFLPFLIISPLLFITGGIFVYTVIFPLAWKFFLSFESLSSNEVIPIMLEAKVSEYLSLVISLIVAFGLAFQIPVILVLLAKFGIIDAKWLKEKRKISIVTIFILAAFLTPPDVISQIALAVPMLILYELSIFACKYIESQRIEENA